MNALTDDSLGSFKKFITELANITYNRDGKGLLLSQVGDIISKKHPEFRNVLGSRKLVGFIEEELAGVVKILTSPENHIVKVILPAQVEINDNVMSFLPQRDATSISVRYPRYNRAFWAAFSHPLAKGYTRLVELEPVVRYEDIEVGAAISSLKKVLPPELIIDQATEPDLAKRTQRINEVINDWLQTNSVTLDVVEAKDETELASARVSGSNKGSLLEVLLAALDDADLKRIQMPLDVVAKLQRRY